MNAPGCEGGVFQSERRETIRRAWDCDCDGKRRPGLLEHPDVTVSLRVVAGETGCKDPPRTCPWRAFEAPLVQAVLRHRQRAEAGVVSGARYSPRMLDALALYDSCYRSAEAKRDERAWKLSQPKGPEAGEPSAPVPMSPPIAR